MLDFHPNHWIPSSLNSIKSQTPSTNLPLLSYFTQFVFFFWINFRINKRRVEIFPLLHKKNFIYCIHIFRWTWKEGLFHNTSKNANVPHLWFIDVPLLTLQCLKIIRVEPIDNYIEFVFSLLEKKKTWKMYTKKWWKLDSTCLLDW